VTILAEPGENQTFAADRQQLDQVLINLAQNAADSMPAGGTLTLRARAGAAELSKKRQAVVMIDVVDTGVGIPPEAQKRLFDPFFSTKDGGTGLGLAIAARIVERHGGVMQFSTRRDHGTTFTVVIPIESNHSESTNSPDRR
jgi:signal transduction histidine kinase